MNTIESNKMIASFMGLGDNQPYQIWEHIRSNASGEETSLYWDNNLRYHDSFDWLMPVVEKIEGLGHDVSILKNAVGLQWCGIGKFSSNNTKATGTTKIEAIYSAVVEFIKWYNKQNQI